MNIASLPLTARYKIVNKRGLHARASAKFVETANRFDAIGIVRFDGEEAEANSILSLLTLGAAMGCVIEVMASGAQAKELLSALETLIATRFGEDS